MDVELNVIFVCVIVIFGIIGIASYRKGNKEYKQLLDIPFIEDDFGSLQINWEEANSFIKIVSIHHCVNTQGEIEYYFIYNDRRIKLTDDYDWSNTKNLQIEVSELVGKYHIEKVQDVIYLIDKSPECIERIFGYGFDKNKLIAYINLSGSNIEVSTEYPISQFIDNQEAEFNYHKNYIEEILQMNIQYYNCFLENMKLGFEQIIIFEVKLHAFLTIVILLIITFIYNFN